MKQNIKNFILSFLVTSLFSIGLYYIITIYDQSGITTLRIKNNIQYLIFLFLSIVISLSIYRQINKKSKLILTIIILINFLYIIFLFGKLNIGLNNTQGLFLIGFLVLALISNYIQNIFGHIVTGISIIGILSIIGFSILPTYDIGPDIKGFQKSFTNKLIITSNININPSKAKITINDKNIYISKGSSSYELNINKSGSNILFISDQKYLNTFGYLIFPNFDIIQIYPQSAINIKNLGNTYQISIIQGIIKQYHNKTGNNKVYIFTGSNLSAGIISKENLENIQKYYKNELKKHLTKQLGINLQEHKTIVYISQIILENLAKLFPSIFQKNLDNFNKFKEILEIKETTNKIKGFDKKNINKGILQNFFDSLSKTEIIH